MEKKKLPSGRKDLNYLLTLVKNGHDRNPSALTALVHFRMETCTLQVDAVSHIVYTKRPKTLMKTELS